MFISSYNTNSQTNFYGSNSILNKSAEFNLSTIPELINSNGIEAAKSGGVLFERFGLSGFDGNGNYRKTYPLKISYDENYSSDNPILNIETKDKNGNTITSKLNISSINPNDATGIEMLALVSNAYKNNMDSGFKAQTFFLYKSVSQAALLNDGNTDNVIKYMEEKNNWNALLKNNMNLYLKVGDVNSYAYSKDLLGLISKYH